MSDAAVTAGERPASAPRAGLRAALLVAVTVLAYLPAFQAGFIWDDDAYITENELLIADDGLARIWTGVEVPQYYPLTFTTFWVERRLWGLDPHGYHAVNVLLHATNAVLVARLLAQLSVPGAWWVGAFFALHPVHVESVAWVTERKNVLSGFFYVMSLTCFLGFVELRSRSRYALAFVFFVAALLSKTVTATLPVAVLLVCWYRRARLGLREVLALTPFFLIGATLGVFTAWLEKVHVGASGPDFGMGLGERVLLAARTLLFYPTKLLVPLQLTFVYPRWSIDPGDPQAYLPLAGVAAVVVGLILIWRRFGPGPLAAFGFYAVTVFPALGFLDVYPFVFSYVADHFQYLASIGVLALVTATAAELGRRLWANPQARARAGAVAAVGILAALGTLTWSQAGIYRDEETLWRDTLTKNPEAWLAHNNLGVILVERGDSEEAIFHYRRAIELYPNFGSAHANLANAFVAEGRVEEAIPAYREAIRLDATDTAARHMLALVLVETGKIRAALPHFRAVARAAPNDPNPRAHLAEALSELGDHDGAIAEYRSALALDPDAVNIRYSLALQLADTGRTADAIAEYKAVILGSPDHAGAHNNMAAGLREIGDVESALPYARRAAEIAPGDEVIRVNLATLLEELGRDGEAIGVLREGLAQNSRSAPLANTLAWYLATAHSTSLRDGQEAVRLAKRACEQTQYRNANLLDTLAAAYAEAGLFSEAVNTARRGLDLAAGPDEAEIMAKLHERLMLYEAGLPYRRSPRTGAAGS